VTENEELALEVEELNTALGLALRQRDEALAGCDDDTRAVRALTSATGKMLGRWSDADEAVRRELWTEVHDRADDVFERFRERYADLDARFGSEAGA
jgi:hypothetical protein